MLRNTAKQTKKSQSQHSQKPHSTPQKHASKQKKLQQHHTRHISNNKSRKLVTTKKRLMLEVPSAPVIQEVGVMEGTTTFDIPTSTVAFTHPLPSVEVANHPLITKPTSTQGQIFAIVDINGAQHKVAKDDQIMVNHLRGVEVGDRLAFEHVYLIGGRDFSVLGKPWVPNVQVMATVEQHTLLSPVTVWKHKRRTGYRKLNRSRDHVTILRIEEVNADDAREFIPQVTSLDMVQLNQIQEGGKILQTQLDDV